MCLAGSALAREAAGDAASALLHHCGRVLAQPDVEPDYTLSGKITQLTRNSGSTRQSTFTFRLTLTDPNTGLEEAHVCVCACACACTCACVCVCVFCSAVVLVSRLPGHLLMPRDGRLR